MQKNHLAYHNILALRGTNRSSEKQVVLIVCALDDIHFENMEKQLGKIDAFCL